MVEAALSRTLSHEAQLALFKLSVQREGEEAVSPFTILLSCFVALVHRLTGDEDISIGTSSKDGDPFVLRSLLSPLDPFNTLLTKVKNVSPGVVWFF